MTLGRQIGHECLGCRMQAALFNSSYFGKFYLTGPDASSAADWLFTNDVTKPPGKRHQQNIAGVKCDSHNN